MCGMFLEGVVWDRSLPAMQTFALCASCYVQGGGGADEEEDKEDTLEEEEAMWKEELASEEAARDARKEEVRQTGTWCVRVSE